MAAVNAPRLAKNYAMVYDIVAAHGEGRHFSAADVFEQAKGRQPGIGETTVYRALARLRELGLLAEISLPGSGSALYELASAAHAHFYCESCGSVQDVQYVLSPDVIDDLAKRNGAQIGHVHLSLHGRCATCTDRGA